MYQLHHRFTDDQSFRSFVQAVANDMAQKGASGVCSTSSTTRLYAP